MRRSSLAAITLLLAAPGCDWLNWPDPFHYPYHGHRVIVHTSVVDSTVGTWAPRPHFRVGLEDGEFRRPGSGFDVFACRYGDFIVYIDSFNDPDTVDTFFVPHFDGLAQHLGGDTNHFARMDPRSGWEWRYRGVVSIHSASRWEDPEYFLLALPDTVTQEVHLRVEAAWPLLREYDWRGRLHYNLDYLRITRIDAN